MRKSLRIIWMLVLVGMILSLDAVIQPALVKLPEETFGSTTPPEIKTSSKEMIDALINAFQSAGPGLGSITSASSITPPRTGINLKELAEALMSATPAEKRIDTDGDGLYDPVEIVIGTDFNSTDSDFDRLDDYWEVMNNLDPLDPDSNSDGLPDYYEVSNVTSSDIDGDGVLNAWDFDNDNDGVGDDQDLSPNSKSIISDSFHFDIRTNGNPTYINLQLKPKDSENLKLFYQLWDWPYDTEGSMKDLDGSKEDIKAIPQLNLTSNFLLDQDKVNDYGIVVTANGMFVPLNPVWEYGNIVAFSGKVFLPASNSSTISLDAELIWRIVGATDVKAVALNAANGKCISVSGNRTVVANANQTDADAMFEWVELSDNEIALKAIDGSYLSVANDGTVVANGTGVGTPESFTLINAGGNKSALKAYNTKYVSLLADATLIANSTTITESEKFELVDLGFQPEWTVLVTYTEDFMLTGFSVEENYSSDLGLFCSSNMNQTLAANLLLTYAFMRNSTTHLLNIPSVLADHGMSSVSYLLGSFSHTDEAFVSMSNYMIPDALDSLPEGRVLPVIIAAENRLKTLEMSEILSGTYVMGDSIAVDLVNELLVTTKTMKTNMYNTTNNSILMIEDAMSEIAGLGLTEGVSYNFMTMMMMWNTGEHFVVQTGGTVAPNVPPENSVLDVLGKISAGTFTGAELGLRGVLGLKAWRELNLLTLKGWNPSSIARYVKIKGTSRFMLWSGMCRKLSHLKTPLNKGFIATWKKTMKWGLEALGAIIDIGMSILAGVFIAQQIGGRLGKEIGAQYGLFAAIYAVVMAVVLWGISQIPYVGWIIALGIALADAFGGFGEKLIGWLVSLFYGDPKDLCTLESSIDVLGEPKITTYDKDNNGLDVGDRIEISCILKGTINHTAGRETYWPLYSWIRPYLSINAPPGSFSTTGMTGIPPSSTWNVTTGNYWKSEEYNSSAWIEPGIGMPNFPVSVQLNYEYRLWHIWEHFEFYFVYWEWCRHEDKDEGTGASHFTTLYYDVLPGNITDFAKWRSIILLDHDGDGLKDGNETRSNPWIYDTDGDGLNDKYEVEMGTDPRNYDTDGDGLVDNFELVYGTNATKGDTDGDKLPDYLEIAGWVIPFNYTGDPNKPFTMRVYSDPRVPDTDGDGVDDYMEYWSDLNPRSKDTDGDGIQDVANPKYMQTAPTFVRALNMTGPALDLVDMDVDADGNLYVLRYPNFNETTRGWTDGIYKFTSNGTFITSWPTWMDIGLSSIAVDDKNGYFYVARRGWEIRQNHLNGTLVRQFPSGSMGIQSMDVDAEGYLYVTSSSPTGVFKFASNGTLVDQWGSAGDGPDKFHNIGEIAVDDKNGYVYVTDSSSSRPNRVTKFTKNGTYITSLPDGFGFPNGIDVDADGYVYVTDTWKDRVQKFDSNGMLIASWGSTGHEDGNFTRPFLVTVDSNAYVYVADNTYKGGDFPVPGLYPLGRIQKFSQRAEEKPSFDDSLPDRDGDGLENVVETAGWNVTFTNATSTFTIHVTSSPLLNDTDSDGFTDYQEYNMTTNPRDPDTDDDGLTDYQEWRGFSPQTNPNHYDTDLDGLPDGVEIALGSDPTKKDTDDDGLSDLHEFQLGSDPTRKDTDGDGLDDLAELMFGSSLANPDSDGDLLFDNLEFSLDTDPNNKDSDGDGLTDGNEVLIGTDPLKSDSDGDNLTDGVEDILWLNPLSNDTDGDGLLDSTELEWGTSPWNRDTDRDGIPDGLDLDSNSTNVKNVILAFDQSNETAEFANNLARYTNVTIVMTDELLTKYSNAPYIVLVGRPDENGTVGKLIKDLLQDSGDVLTKMIASEGYRFAVRYGIWNKTQTIVMLSHPDPGDYSKVLDILRNKIVTILPDSVRVEYLHSLAVQYPSGGSLNHNQTSYNFFTINEIDTVKQADAIVSAVLEKEANPTIQLNRYNNSTVPTPLNQASGLAVHERAVGKYLGINVSENVQNQTSEIVSAAMVQIYYKLSDLDRTGDGDAEDPGDFNEKTLTLYFFNESSRQWTKLSKSLNWVIETGVNTTDIELYGNSYAGYVWASVSRFSSIYGIAGLLNNRPPEVSKAYPSKKYLWPPNHKFVEITIEGVTDPDGDNVTITIISITSDEPTASKHCDCCRQCGWCHCWSCRFKHAPDAYGIGTDTAHLRAERNGDGNGRVYEITFMASDGKGGETIGTVKVYVPHNKKGKTWYCIDDGQKYDASKINWHTTKCKCWKHHRLLPKHPKQHFRACFNLIG